MSNLALGSTTTDEVIELELLHGSFIKQGTNLFKMINRNAFRSEVFGIYNLTFERDDAGNILSFQIYDEMRERVVSNDTRI